MRAALAAALLAALPSAGGAAEEESAWPPPPLAWQEPSPVARLFLQPAFEAPEALAAGQLRAGARLIYSNSIMVETRPGLSLLTDVETAQVTLQLSAGLGGGLEARVALPAALDWGGLLDEPIDAVERALRARNPDRARRPRNRAAWTLLRSDGRGLSRTGPGAGLGDAWLGLKLRLAEGGGALPAASLRLALSLPTGRLPWGAGMLTPSAGLLAAWRLGPAALRVAADVALPSARLREVELSTRPYGAFDAGLAWPLGERLALQLQASAHAAPLRGTGLDQLDHATAYVLAGVSARLAGGAVVELGVAENVFSPYRGADLTFLVALRGP